MNNNSLEYECDLSSVNYEELSSINKLNYKMQQLMPAVRLMQIKCPSTSLLGLERNQKLRIMGYSENEIREMCVEEPGTRGETLANVMKAQKQELRRLATFDQVRREADSFKEVALSNESGAILNNEPVLDDAMLDEVEIFILDRDFPDKLKEVKARCARESEAEFNQMLAYGIQRGFVEPEQPTEPKL